MDQFWDKINDWKSLLHDMRILESLDVGGPAFFRNGAFFYGGISVSGAVGAFSMPTVAKTGAYTLGDLDFVVNVISGTFTITFPTAVGISGRIYVIKNSGTGVVTLDGSGSETFDGSTTVSLNPRYSCVWVQSDGTNWVILSAISPVKMN